LVRPFLLHCVDKGEAWDEGQPVSGVQYKDASGQLRTSKAHLTVCCDGMYSTFREKLAKPSIHHPSFFVALLLKNVKLPYPNHGHVVLCQPSPVLFYPISSKEVRTERRPHGCQSLQQHRLASGSWHMVPCCSVCAQPTACIQRLHYTHTHQPHRCTARLMHLLSSMLSCPPAMEMTLLLSVWSAFAASKSQGWL
jgi:hypothetical protein